MKYTGKILAALCLSLLFCPASVRADQESGGPVPEPTATQEPSPEPAVTEEPESETFYQMQIDNENVYKHMDRAYKDGYDPAVTSDTARIVLPLITKGKVQGSQIRVSIDLGDPDRAPFVFKNYDQTIPLKSHSVNQGKDTVSSYLIDVAVPLTEERQAGRYPVQVNISGQWEEGSPFSQEFLLYVTIPEAEKEEQETVPGTELPMDSGSVSGAGVVSDASSDPEEEEEPPSQARVLLERFSVSPSPVQTGGEFAISAVFKNTSEEQPLDNVKITVREETAQIIPAGDETGSFYFKKIDKNKSVTIKMKLQTAHNAAAEPHRLKFTVEYDGEDAQSYTAEEEAVIQVSQPLRLEFDEPQIPKEVNAGDTLSVSGNVMNLGLGTVYNVRMQVEADGLQPEETAFLGNIESGKAQKGELYAFVGTLKEQETQEDTSQDKYGTTQGTVIFLYEDEYGQEYREEFEFSTSINPPVILGGEEKEEEEEPKKQGQWWISVIAAALLAAGAFGARVYIKRKQENMRRLEDTMPDDLKF